ncbi:MAG: hypothetical protein AAB426_07735, partial [Myxococcota bacterium]
KRSVLKRTRSRADLPAVVLYLGPLSGQMKQKVMTPEGSEQDLADGVMSSYYKLVTGTKGKELLESHWPAIAAEADKAKA